MQEQSVALVSSTEGTKLYHTTDGSEPTLAGGTLTGTTMEYTASIAVTVTADEGYEILDMGSIAGTGTKTFDHENDYRFFQAGTIIFTAVSRLYYLDKKV